MIPHPTWNEGTCYDCGRSVFNRETDLACRACANKKTEDMHLWHVPSVYEARTLYAFRECVSVDYPLVCRPSFFRKRRYICLIALALHAAELCEAELKDKGEHVTLKYATPFKVDYSTATIFVRCVFGDMRAEWRSSFNAPLDVERMSEAVKEVNAAYAALKGYRKLSREALLLVADRWKRGVRELFEVYGVTAFHALTLSALNAKEPDDLLRLLNLKRE